MRTRVKHKSKSVKEQGFDIIGDTHGCAKSLQTLLEKLDYHKVNGVYRHKNRSVIFLGDLIDRGPRIRETLHIARDMHEHGSARIVMGNHEYNAISYCTRAHPGSSKKYLREHNHRNNRIIQETLEQFSHYGHEWNNFLEWFMSLPIFIEERDFRVVHACWDAALIARFRETHPEGVIDEDFLHASAVRRSFAGRVMDRLLRGTDLPLPNGMSMTSRDGYVRSFFRTKFWADNPETYDDIVFQPDQLPEQLRHRTISDEERKYLLSYGADQPPVFIGHYWLSGTPAPVKHNVGCLDYSAVKAGKLVAYRMDGEQRLKPEKFVWVSVEQDGFG